MLSITVSLMKSHTQSTIASLTRSVPLFVGALLLTSMTADSSIRQNPISLLQVQQPQLIWQNTHHSRIIPQFKSATLGGINSGVRVKSFDASSHDIKDLGDRSYKSTNYKVPFTTIIGQNHQSTAEPMFEFDGVGFPNIVTSKRKAAAEHKPYRSLIKLVGSAEGETIALPNLRCHGYSVERTARRAAVYDKAIQQLAERYEVNANLVKAVITRESCFRENAQSHVGAYGLMQLMPETAKWLGVTDPADAQQNLKAGIRYLGQLQRRFGSIELALAAYNAGPGNVERYNGIPPFAETQSYVKTVLSYWNAYNASNSYALDNKAS